MPERRSSPTLPRYPHPVELRAWVLDHSPARVRQFTFQRLEAFFSSLGNSFSSASLGYWKAFLLGAEARTGLEKLRSWDENLRKDPRATKDYLTLACITYTFCERFDVPLVCDQPPFWVPIDHIHLFDLAPSQIRAELAEAIQQVQSEDISNKIEQLFAAPAKFDEFDLPRFRPVVDRLVAFLLRYSGGLEIHNLGVRAWIAANAHRARHAIDPKERDSAVRSLENVADALLPSDWAGRTPNEAGLSLEYIETRNSLAPVLRKKHRNPNARLLALKEKLPDMERAVLERMAKSTPRRAASTLLGHKYGVSPGYLENLLKRGNLFLRVSEHWSQSLAEIPLDDFLASPA